MDGYDLERDIEGGEVRGSCERGERFRVSMG